MKLAAKGIEHFFPDATAGETRLSELGYFPIHVSVFDHWLSHEECDASDILFYDEAVRNGELGAYMAGENNLVAFYQRLARSGAYVHEVIIDRTHFGLVRKSYWETDCDDKDFLALLRERLREKRRLDTCCLYFPEFSVRYFGGYDRTDLLLLRNKDLLPAIAEVAKEHQLHLLDAGGLDYLKTDTREDPDSGYRLQKDQGKHGWPEPREWKLLDDLEDRAGSLSKEGRYLGK
jgi:hypothetical protein